jgi:hypothetical protein
VASSRTSSPSGRLRNPTGVAPMRADAADATAQVGRRICRHPHDEGVVTGGWRSGRNCDGNASERAAGEDLEEGGPDRWAPSISDGGAVMGWQGSSRAEMGRRRCRAGPAAKETGHADFFHFKTFSN